MHRIYNRTINEIPTESKTIFHLSFQLPILLEPIFFFFQTFQSLSFSNNSFSLSFTTVSFLPNLCSLNGSKSLRNLCLHRNKYLLALVSIPIFFICAEVVDKIYLNHLQINLCIQCYYDQLRLRMSSSHEHSL